MPLDVLGAAALARARQSNAQLGDELLHAVAVGMKGWIGCVDGGMQRVHGRQRLSASAVTIRNNPS